MVSWLASRPVGRVRLFAGPQSRPAFVVGTVIQDVDGGAFGDVGRSHERRVFCNEREGGGEVFLNVGPKVE